MVPNDVVEDDVKKDLFSFLVRIVNRNPQVPISHLPSPIAKALAAVLPMLPRPFVDVVVKDSVGDPSRAKSTFGLNLTSLRSIW